MLPLHQPSSRPDARITMATSRTHFPISTNSSASHYHHHHQPQPLPHYHRKKRGAAAAGPSNPHVAGPLRQLVDGEEDIAGTMGGGSSRDASEEDNDAFSEASDSASSLHQYTTRRPLAGALGPSNLSATRRAYQYQPHNQASSSSSQFTRDSSSAASPLPPSALSSQAGSASRAPVPSTLASSSSTDLAHYGADDEGRGEPIAGPGGGLKLHRIDSIGSSSTASLAPDDEPEVRPTTNEHPSSNRRSRAVIPTTAGLNLGSLPAPSLSGPAATLSSANASTPVAVPTPTPRQGGTVGPSRLSSGNSQAKRPSRSQLRDDYLAFQYGSEAESDTHAPSEASSLSSTERSRGAMGAATVTSGTAFTRTANHTDSEAHRSGSDTDQGTASPYDGDVEFAARTPVSMQVTNMTGAGPAIAAPLQTLATSKDVQAAGNVPRHVPHSKAIEPSTPVSPTHLSNALAAASVSSHGASADVESSVESTSPPAIRSSHRQTISAHGFPLSAVSQAKSNEVKDVPSRVYSSGSTLTNHRSPKGGDRTAVGTGTAPLRTPHAEQAAPEIKGTTQDTSSGRPVEPDCDTICKLTERLNSVSQLATLLQNDRAGGSAKTPLRVYVQTSFDVPSLEACSSRLRTAKLLRGRGEHARDVIVIAGVTNAEMNALPLQQRAALARNCRWVDEVVEGVPFLEALDQLTGALSTDSAHQLQIQRILKDVGADCAARFCTCAGRREGGGDSAASSDETGRILNLPLF